MIISKIRTSAGSRKKIRTPINHNKQQDRLRSCFISFRKADSICRPLYRLSVNDLQATVFSDLQNMAAAFSEDLFDFLAVFFHEIILHKGLDAAGKAAAMDAGDAAVVFL